jgi:hypothetical protein
MVILTPSVHWVNHIYGVAYLHKATEGGHFAQGPQFKRAPKATKALKFCITENIEQEYKIGKWVLQVESPLFL